MATVSSDAPNFAALSKRFEKCGAVDYTFASIDDGDTFTVGPDAYAVAFVGEVENVGEVGCILDRATQTVTFDTAASAQAGRLRVFLGGG